MSELNAVLTLKMLLVVFCLLLRITSGEEINCGGEVISEGRGSIKFCGIPGLDTNECIWTIYISDQSKVTAKLDACTLIVEKDGSYEMSYIEVRDGENADDPLIGNYTHWHCSSSISIGYASTNAMWIRLVSPTITNEDIYFDLQFDACGGNIKTKGDSVSSPFYPDSYLKGGNCTWTINTYQGTVFSSNFDAFKLRYSEDSIEIGNDVSNGEADIGRYTNDDHPWTVNNTESNSMWITLTAFELPEQNGTGHFHFQIALKVIGGNGGDIFGQRGFIISPGNSKAGNGIVPNIDATYTWNIYCPNGTFVLGTFVDFSIFTYDKVSIFDGDESEPFVEYQEQQGQDKEFNTTGNKMVVQLNTFEHSSRGYGRFELHFEGLLLSTSEVVTGYNGTVYSPLYPLPYPMDLEYTTEISTPSGTIMDLEFKELVMRKGDNVSVYDQDGHLLALFKSGKNLAALETHTNITLVVLHSGREDRTRIGTYSLEFGAKWVCFLPDGDINGELYPEDDIYWPGDELMITCHEGYELSTNYTNVTCETDGSWSDDFPTCIAVVCGDPGEVENGESEGDDFTYGSNVTYRCQEGYTLNGTSTVTCLSNGTWSDDLPRCTIVSCENPGPLENGEEIGDTYLYGSNITYRCHEGYHLNGSETITCQSDGTWNEKMPVCMLVSCGSPGPLENGEEIGDTYTYGSNVTYNCNEGYHLNGSETITCQSNGTWNEEMPVCIPVVCGDPGEVENGESEGDDFTYGNNVTYRCHEGYTLNGTSTITCLSNGTWDDDLPQCIIVSCENPGPLENGEEIGDTYTYGSNITYHCNEGYHLNGSETIACQSDGTWNEEMPVCMLVSCGNPGPLENGDETGDIYTYGSNITYNCNEGYHLNGSETITCQSDGSWNEEMPVCTPVVCDDPGEVENGESEGDDFTYGSNVTYRCQEGYTLNGTSTITCLSNGTWHDDLPQCIIVSCGSPGPLENGEEIGDTYTYGSNITYHCNEGYHLNGSETITCQSDGTWNDDIPICMPIDCDEPDDVENSEKHGDSYLYDDVVVYKCNEGYHFESNVTYIVCQENGEWSELPVCLPLEADNFLAILVIVLVILVILLIVLAVLCRRLCKSKSKAKQDHDYHYDLDTIQGNGFEAALASGAVDYGAINMNDKENGNLYSPQENLMTTFTSNSDDSQPGKTAASVSNLNADNSGVNADKFQNDLKFVENDIYEGSDNNVTVSRQGADATNNLAKVAVIASDTNGVHSTASDHDTGFKSNEIYESADGADIAPKAMHTYADLDENKPLRGNNYGKVVSEPGITSATPGQEYDCIVPRVGEKSHHGLTNAAEGHVDNVIYQSSDVAISKSNTIFTDNILYASSGDGTENITNTVAGGAGFVDNVIYEYGNETKENPDSKFVDNVLYEATGDVNRGEVGDVANRNEVHYHTLEKPEPEISTAANTYDSVDIEKF